MKPIGVVIHHSAGNESTATQLRSIFKSRFNVSYIGYHYAISKTGEVWKDLRDDQIGIHNNEGSLNNSNSLGICLIGNLETNQPTVTQLNKLKEILTNLKKTHGITATNIVGHRDMKSTACPGKNLYSSLARLIKEVYASTTMANFKLYQDVRNGKVYYKMFDTNGNLVQHVPNPAALKEFFGDSPEVTQVGDIHEIGLPTDELLQQRNDARSALEAALINNPGAKFKAALQEFLK